MKGVTFIFFITAGCFFLGLQPEESIAQAVEGRVEGVVILAPKETPSRLGGRYGRPSQSPVSQEASADSVLIWIEGSGVSNTSGHANYILLDQTDLKFSPKLVPVRQYGTVRIRNSDPVYHNVFSLSSIKRFDVGRRPKGEYLDVVFDKPGIVDVFCDIHSNMRAAIYVLSPEAVQWTKAKSGESFALDNISPGSYELKIYAMGYQERMVSVEVNSGEPANVGTITLNF